MNDEINKTSIIKSVIEAVWSAALAMKFRPGQSQEEIAAEYTGATFDIMAAFVDSEGGWVTFRNAFRRVMNDAFNYTVAVGWVDGGGQGSIPDELQSWVNGQIDGEIEFIDELFAQLREIRKEGDADKTTDFIQAKSEGYAGALIGVYNYAKMFAAEEQEGEWVFGDTDHCDTCANLNGQKHPLRWFISRGYIPQQRGSETLDCGGWNCQCRILDGQGKQLIP